LGDGMKWRTIAVAVLALAVCAASAATARAADPAKQTPFSTNEALEVPGMMLEPGQYLLRLIEPTAEPNVLQVFEIVQLWTGDQNRLLSTLLTMPNYDLPTTDKTVFTFFERGPKQSKALRLWFAPGRNYGQEFIYPKRQAVELAKAVGRGVLSMPPELPGNIGMLARTVEGVPAPATAPIAGAASEPRPTSPQAPPKQSPPEVNKIQHDATGATVPLQGRARARDPKAARGSQIVASSLPKTAGYLPLVALLGVLSFAGGALLRVLALRLEQP
jgi:hypothetical protein